MAAHGGENQGTVQPNGGLPRNQVSELTSQEWGVVRVSEELDRVICKVGQLPQLISENLAEARIAGKYRSQMMTVIENQAKAVCRLLGELKKSTEGYSQFGKELFRNPELVIPRRPCSPHLVLPAEPWDKADTEDRGRTYKLLAYMQANTCVSPGVFKGMKHENFEEFIRRFGRKYKGVIMDDHTLIEILGDEHLEGRAKNVFLSIPEEVRGQGFRAVVDELRRLLANDSMAGRLRALTELRNLRRRPGQTVSEFCVVLEKLGRQANPHCSVGDRSLEYAQILLDNLTDWPEHSLLSAIHAVEPHEAYNAVKQLALSMEQSKEMLGLSQVKRREERDSWRRRSYAYEERDAKLQYSREGRRAEVSRDKVTHSYAEGSGYLQKGSGEVARTDTGFFSKGKTGSATQQ
ncbi:hypothetical protein Aduo_015851 [Ancylostoma duodenale]